MTVCSLPIVRIFAILSLCIALGSVGGCASKRMTELQRKPHDPLDAAFFSNDIGSHKNPERYSDRVELTLRAYDLEKTARIDPLKTLAEIRRHIQHETSPELLYAFAEIAYFQGKNLEKENPELATEIYFAAIEHAYRYLFDPTFHQQRNHYDTQFRGICLIYNNSLTQILRLMGEEYDLELQADQTYAIHTGQGSLKLHCRMDSEDWNGEQIERFKFCSDYVIKGLQNEYRQSGLGVPLIAIRKTGEKRSPEEKYYPHGLCFPVTAFLRPIGVAEFDKNDQATVHAVLELHDPLAVTHIDIAGQSVPLENDLTTPLAYFLSNPLFNIMGAVGLLRPEELFKSRFLPETGKQIVQEEEKYRHRKRGKHAVSATFRGEEPEPQAKEGKGAESIRGIYMMQPYDPGKIPVVMIHGLGSSPITWVEMFNNLRSSPEIRRNYQFWFYYYPSAQPFWVSAAQLREDLAEIRATLNPQENVPALDEMILVGHSMGGLISRMQVIDSGDRVWKLVSDRPFESIRVSAATKVQMRKWFFFRANPSIDRVVTIATPFQGSDFANNFTQWLSHRLIRLPQTLTGVLQEFTVRNDPQLKDDSLMKMKTSVDSLSPENPLFSVLRKHTPPAETSSHNIIGVEEWSGVLKYLNAEGDGIVKSESARLKGVHSEIAVPSMHSYVHTHPRAIMEVRRILLENLQEKENGEVPVWHEIEIPDFVPELSPLESIPLKERPEIWGD